MPTVTDAAPGPRLRLGKTRDLLEVLGFHGEIQGRSRADPGRAPMARGADSLMDERLRQVRRFTDTQEDHRRVLPHVAAALTVIRRLINRARTTHRWTTRPTTRRLR